MEIGTSEGRVLQGHGEVTGRTARFAHCPFHFVLFSQQVDAISTTKEKGNGHSSEFSDSPENPLRRNTA